MTFRGNLPADPTTFVGRDRLLAATVASLGSGPLVTLIGAGGVGKTRVALKVGEQVRQRGDYLDGVWFVQLAGLREPGSLARTVARSLSIVDNSREAGLVHLLEALQDKHLLLILDNCEHLLAAVQELVHGLLQGCSKVTVLATSREQLDVYGERIIRVPPLCVDGVNHADELGRLHEAVQLFVDRATDAGHSIDEDELPEVAHVCALLDGLPLAIELAAARLGELAVTEIREQLSTRDAFPLDMTDQRFTLLVNGDRTGQQHHRTLQRALDWSAQRCSPAERELWARLSIFPADFARDAVIEVCAGNGIEADQLAELLTSLVRKSILIAQPSGVTRRSRYRMLETVAQYGAQHLGRRTDRQQLARAHAGYVRRLVRSAAEDWFSPREVRWMGTLLEEWPGIRAAIAFYLAQPGLETVGAEVAIDVSRTRFGCFAGMLGQTQDLLDRVLAALPAERGDVRMAILAHNAWIALVQGDTDAAMPYLAQVHDASAVSGDTDEIALQLRYAKASETFLAERAPARARASVSMFADLFAEFRRVSARGDTHMVELFAAMTACFLGDRQDADTRTAALLASVEEHHARWSMSWALWTRGLFELLHADPGRAFQLGQRALAIQLEIRDTWGPSFTLWLLACAAGELGASARAARLFGGVRTQASIVRVRFAGLGPWARVQDRIEQRCRHSIGHDDFDEAMHLGSRMSFQDLLVEALEDIPDAEWQSEGEARIPGGLTEQEFRIAALVADALSSKDIGDRLGISPRTVETHLMNARAKLGLANRAALAAWYRATAAALPRPLNDVWSGPTGASSL
ncbi:LuxR family transcriptional regulator [Lentzea sp. NBRC 105346]|uniref:ATP-binding protein n=1 Tax=Lentzea sp. NBRC 105346 TaxID=3032205 RepID=UPI0024A587A4|nr:LuxR C-terminal-related transcriptional regulator [Lentzea sp. NBRC 105346]GLZ28206.1 LuxR family transcriptional regulator [Lentzea sp. NBRC 105346]